MKKGSTTKNHKYIQKIGDRYFYTMKELQAYYNSKKANTLKNVSAKAAQTAVNYANKGFANNIWEGETLKTKHYMNMASIFGWVARQAGTAAAKSAAKVIEANAAISKRQVQRELEEKHGNVNNWLKSIREDWRNLFK